MTTAEDTSLMSHFKFHRLSLRLAANLAIACFVGFGLIIFLVAVLISTQFEALEDADIDRRIAITEDMLATLQETTREKASDWSIWTATYDYINDQNEAYATDNLDVGAFNNLGVEAAAFVGWDGVSRYTVYFDLDEGEPIPELTEKFKAFVTAPEILAMARETPSFQGFVQIGDRLLVVSFSQVIVSGESGEPNGYLVFATELQGSVMSDALQVSASYTFTPAAEGSHATRTDEDVAYFVNVSGVDGVPIAAIEFQTPRALLATGRSLLTAIALGIASLLFAMVVMLYLRLNYLVVAPLAAIEKHVTQISISGVLVEIPNDGRPDEIGKLKAGFNEMTKQLDLLQSKLEIQSYELGQSQSSIDTMHNVRNGLSPIGPILDRLVNLTEQPMKDDIQKATEELSNAETPADRRLKVAMFLKLAQEKSTAQMTQAQGLIGDADQSISAVIAAIEQSQSGHDAPPETAPVAITELVSKYLTLAQFPQKSVIKVDIAGLTPCMVDTNRVLFGQVLNNILANAVESITAAGHSEGQIIISGDVAAIDDRDHFRLTIIDNGEGFDPGMVNRLFERGYSTRPYKRGGIGLHWSANTLTAISGSLRVSSDGEGRGATVEIILPLSAPANVRTMAPQVLKPPLAKAS